MHEFWINLNKIYFKNRILLVHSWHFIFSSVEWKAVLSHNNIKLLLRFSIIFILKLNPLKILKIPHS